MLFRLDHHYYQWFSASLALLLWGVWTFFANEGASPDVRVVASFAQGLTSFTFTLLLVKVVEYLSPLFHAYWIRLLIPVFITVTGTTSLLVSIHWLIGTPNILVTIFPPCLVAFLFCLYSTIDC